MIVTNKRILWIQGTTHEGSDIVGNQGLIGGLLGGALDAVTNKKVGTIKLNAPHNQATVKKSRQGLRGAIMITTSDGVAHKILVYKNQKWVDFLTTLLSKG